MDRHRIPYCHKFIFSLFIVVCQLPIFAFKPEGADVSSPLRVFPSPLVVSRSSTLDTVPCDSSICQLIRYQLEHGVDYPDLDERKMAYLSQHMHRDIAVILRALQNRNIKHAWPRIIILDGEPGVGKTTLAHFIPRSLRWKYAFIPATAVATKWANSGAENFGMIFALLHAYSRKEPIMFGLDEMNAVADKDSRGHHVDGGTNMAFWMGIDSLDNVVIIGTTNQFAKHKEQIVSRALRSIITLTKSTDLRERSDNVVFQLSPFKHQCSEQTVQRLANDRRLVWRDVRDIINQALLYANARNARSLVIKDEDVIEAYQKFCANWVRYRKAKAEQIDDEEVSRRTLKLNEQNHQLAVRQFEHTKKQTRAAQRQQKLAESSQRLQEQQLQLQEEQARETREAQRRSEALQEENTQYAWVGTLGPVGWIGSVVYYPFHWIKRNTWG